MANEKLRLPTETSPEGLQ